jgi:hypothetical protein
LPGTTAGTSTSTNLHPAATAAGTRSRRIDDEATPSFHSARSRIRWRAGLSTSIATQTPRRMPMRFSRSSAESTPLTNMA